MRQVFSTLFAVLAFSFQASANPAATSNTKTANSELTDKQRIEILEEKVEYLTVYQRSLVTQLNKICRASSGLIKSHAHSQILGVKTALGAGKVLTKLNRWRSGHANES